MRNKNLQSSVIKEEGRVRFIENVFLLPQMFYYLKAGKEENLGFGNVRRFFFFCFSLFCCFLMSGQVKAPQKNGKSNGEPIVHYCFNSEQNPEPFNDPDIYFPVATCLSNIDYEGNACTLVSTNLSFTAREAIGNLGFDVVITNTTSCTGISIHIETIDLINNSVLNFPVPCEPGDGSTFKFAISNIENRSGDKDNTEYIFNFSLSSVYSYADQNNSEVTVNPGPCGSIDFSFDFVAPEIADGDGGDSPFDLCKGDHLDLEVDGIDLAPGMGAYSAVWGFSQDPPLFSIGGISFVPLANYQFTGMNSEVEGVTLTLINNGFANHSSGCDNVTLPPGLIRVYSTPSVSVSPNNGSICPGQSITLTPQGAGGYQWMPGNIYSTSALVVQPAQNTVYQVKGILNYGVIQCFSDHPATATVTLKPAPDFSVSASPQYACAGTPCTLSAQGNFGQSETFQWLSPSQIPCAFSNGSCVATVTPQTSEIYSVSGINGYGCASTKSISINVAPNPEAVIGLANGPFSPSDAVPTSHIFLCNLKETPQWIAAVNQAQNYAWTIIPNDGHLHISISNVGQSVYLQADAATPTSSSYTITLTQQNFPQGGNLSCERSAQLLVLPCCSVETSGYPELIDGIFSGGTLPPNLHHVITGQLEIAHATQLNGAIFIMNPGSSIQCNDNLTLMHCHFYGCSDLWNGITFQANSPGNNQPVLSMDHCLIEDAVCGVDAADAMGYNGAGVPHPQLNLNNTWFNRCAVGIANDFNPLNPTGTFPPAAYGQLNLSHCIFTCRENMHTGIVFSDNYAALNTLPFGFLHNFKDRNDFISFTGIATGGNHPNFTDNISNCTFDNLMDGVLSGGNAVIQNCTFQNCGLVQNSANDYFLQEYQYACNSVYGPFVCTKAGAGVNFNGSELLAGGGSTVANSFNSCTYGILANGDGSAPISINGNHFIATKKGGIYLTIAFPSVPLTHNIEINGNNFVDHYREGILAFFEAGSGGVLKIHGNTFKITNPFYGGLSNSDFYRFPEAISVHGFGFHNVGTVYIDNNEVSNYGLGIRVNAMPGVEVMSNRVEVFERSDISQNQFTHGIFLSDCDGASVTANHVFNSGLVFDYNEFGIFIENCANAHISCNQINGPDVSLKCQGPNSASVLENNIFSNAGAFKIWLDQNGFIGPQGRAAAVNFPLGFCEGNQFINGSISDLFTSGNSIGRNSPFWVRNISTYAIGSSTSSFAGSNVMPVNYLGISAGLPRSCMEMQLGSANKLPAMLQSDVSHPIASGSLHFLQYDSVAQAGNYHKLLRTLRNPKYNLFLSDDTLQSFMNAMQGATMDQLAEIDMLLEAAAGDSTKLMQVKNMNASLLPEGVYEIYLREVNSIFLEYLSSNRTFNLRQKRRIMQIAQLCPNQFGEGVYRARSLAMMVDTVRDYMRCQDAVNSGSGNRTEGNNEKSIGVKLLTQQPVSLFPNPATNQITIVGLPAQGEELTIEVFNALSELVQKEEAAENFENLKIVDVSGLRNGIYYCRVRYGQSIILNEKLVLQK